MINSHRIYVTLPVRYRAKGKKWHKPNTKFAVSKAEAARLSRRYGPEIMSGNAAGKVLEIPHSGEKPEGDALVSAIAAAILSLDKDNPDHFSKRGRPQAPALQEVLGYPVTAKERDAAWRRVQSARR